MPNGFGVKLSLNPPYLILDFGANYFTFLFCKMGAILTDLSRLLFALN